MDAIDNPSYFSLPSESHKKSKHNFLRQWSENKTSATLPANSSAKKSTQTGRRNFRTLMRANSEDTQLLVLGKPRPSDLAPSVYSNRQQRHRSTGNVTASNDLLQDMVHCGGMADDDGDVFLSDNANVQYYNTSTLPMKRILTSSRRRHSIGSFLNRDRSFAGSVNDADTRHESSFRRKFKRITADKVGKMEDELDVLLVSCGDSEAATLWVNYLVTCFQLISREQNKPPFKLQCIRIEDILIPLIGNNGCEKCPDARLQIVIVCPLFLQKIQTVPEDERSLGKVFHPDKLVAMMLGVQQHLENKRVKTVIPNYEQWRKMTVKGDQDPTFVGDFLGVAMDILSKSWQMQEAVNSDQQRNFFSIFPKKIKVGQNKIIVLLTEPLADEDVVKIFIDKTGQRSEIGVIKKRNPYTLQFTMPASCLQVSNLVNICVEKNGKSLGKRMVKCESKMRELDQILRSVDNPIHFMCQSFNLHSNDREQLDSFLLSVFVKNLPSNFNLLNPNIPINKTSPGNEEFPTLLHFTAKYGLEKLSWHLMESPGGEQACQIRNSSHLTPAEIAERANHPKLANILKGYMQMTELSNVYNYLKVMSDKQKGFPENNYLLPRPLSDTYIIPPAARPVDPSITPVPITDACHLNSGPYYANFKPCNFVVPASSPASVTSNMSFGHPAGMENYEVPRNGRPYTPRTPPTPSSPTERKFEGYLEMNSPGNESYNFGSISSFNTNADFAEHFGSFGKLDRYESVSSPTESHASSSKYGSAHHSSSREKLSPDDELVEIFNDFKNNVFTITEVEDLVKSWQNRNDVQQSMRDRQEQLNKMREEYDRIQRKMKDDMKRTTPFERIRKFFSRGKSKHSENHERNSISSDMSISQTRPVSNISLHSSSSASSGTNSIGSSSGITLDGTNTRKHADKNASSQEKSHVKEKNSIHYAEIPLPPKHLDLSSNPDFEYVQPDSVDCNTNNRSNSCGSSVVNEVIHECVETDNSETRSDSKVKPESANRWKTYHLSNILRSHKISEKHRTNSLRFEPKDKSKSVKNKVKSAENLIYDRDYANINYDKNSTTERIHFEEVDKNLEKTVENCPRDEHDLSACQALCAQTIKCLSEVNDDLSNEDIASEITFEFEKIAEHFDSSTQSECSSRHNSSLNLSSLSLNSNCTVDENGEMKCHLELKITEEADMETENAPPASSEIQSEYVNMCTLPEYVNVSIQNSSPLSRRYKCTAVSS